MTSKLSERTGTVIVVVCGAAALALVVVLWALLAHGTYTRQPHVTQLLGVQDITTVHSKQQDADRIKGGKELADISHVDGYVENKDTEFVKPLKISPALHDHDIIYDHMYAKETQDQPSIRHHSGHFRHKMAEIWDPHPEYEISAFGNKFHLVLAHNDKFVLPQLQVTHVWQNFTKKVKPEFKTSGCYYTGKVKGEEGSNVAVSLCGGMTGYIYSNEGSYYIEPVEKLQEQTLQTILHKIHKIHPNGKQSIVNDHSHADQCGTDDLSSQPFEQNEANEHRIHKREVKKSGVRRARNHQYYIETLVVADKKMAEYHKTEDGLLHYILTLMSHVALLYKDATIGNPITILVVNILILKDREFVTPTHNEEGVNSSEMLRNFCAFQKQINVHESSPDGPKHHDVALLLTRETICRNYKYQSCDTLGLAELGTMCSASSSCAIIKDKGLPTSYTIAHELGHVLSMPHDDDKHCAKFHGNVRVNNIMTRMMQNDSKPWLWSACSKYFLTEFLETKQSQCLLNHPEFDLIGEGNISKRLPGETFNQDKQCELVFGKGSKICSFMPRCGSLWCATSEGEEDGCTTKYLPWADGTPCGVGKWCHRGECVALDRGLLQPIDGSWGQWQPWGDCSLPCGGGVKRSVRSCDNPPPANGGSYCTGPSIRYLSCNIYQCDESVMDFRAEQCAHFNGNHRGIANLTEDVMWLPKHVRSPHDDCKLYCTVAHTNSSYLLAQKVIDGTKCGPDTHNICLNGICHPAGCDNVLDSNKTLDECGVCGGNNSKCKQIDGNYNGTYPFGYNKVLRIPKGSSSIEIMQYGFKGTSKDDNYLALVDSETGQYILNGNSQVSTYRKLLYYAGVTIEYSGSNSVIERINSSRRIQLKKDLIVEILSVGRLLPADIRYSYKITSDSIPKYSWQLYGNMWTPCSSICSGTTSTIPTCVELETRRIVSNDECSQSAFDGATQTRDCNTDCILSWKIASRGLCSSHCGPGKRTLYYRCTKEETQSNDSNQALIDGTEATLENSPWAKPVDDLHCSNIPKPSEYEACQGSCNETRWEYFYWSECSKTCGGGIKTRTAICVNSKDNSKIDHSFCDTPPELKSECNTGKCPHWTYIEWTPCSVRCGRGNKTKPAICLNGNEIVSSNYCNPADLNIPIETCFERPCTKWHTGDWSLCSASCGKGLKKREVTCRTEEGKIWRAGQCNGNKPSEIETCYYAKCPEVLPINEENNSIFTAEWRSGAWSECSKSCNSGTQSRMVVCQNIYGHHSPSECDPSKRPRDTIICNSHPCPAWRYGSWTSCDSNCYQYRQVLCKQHDGKTVSDEKCNRGNKPANSTKCDSKCEKKDDTMITFAQWKIGQWSQCSKTCGTGVRTRQVSCVDSSTGATVVDNYCHHQRKPKSHKMCRKPDCPYMWVESPWTQCTVSCGEGLQYRNVTCHKVLAGGKVDSVPLSEHPRRGYCDAESKPPGHQKCTIRYCNQLYSWHAGPWRECSHQCGRKGRQTRHLSCHDQNGKNVQKSSCSKDLKPPRKRKCNQKKCNLHSCLDYKIKMKAFRDKEYELTIQEKKVMIYCHNMNQSHPQEFVSLPNERDNYAEIYDKRLVNSDSCPHDGHRREHCDCVPADSERSGLTVFSKVRLNITSLTIIGNDFTYSRQIKGKAIPFGTAGDCYSSRHGCPQGRFSINLSGTRFNISSRTNWITRGQMSSILIHRQENRVSAKCGGYCGHCEPDHSIGIALDVV